MSASDSKALATHITQDEPSAPGPDGRVRKKLHRRLFSYVEAETEFRYLEYTPCTLRRPIDVPHSLRCGRSGRQLRLCLCVTAHKEDDQALTHTLTAIAKNMPALAAAGVAWEQVAVVIMVDGMARANARFMSTLTELLLIDQSIMVQEHAGWPVTMHLFERTIHLSKSSNQQEYYAPLQVLVGLKVLRGGKLNSHLWFTHVCRAAAAGCGGPPAAVCFIDVGNILAEDALARLYKQLDRRADVGGVCGHQLTGRLTSMGNVLVAAQTFEFRTLHIMDKAMESECGYVPDMSAELSMYRWAAIDGAPLAQYFTAEERPVHEMGPQQANMYLREDSVLSLALLTAPKSKWTTRYDSAATVEVPPPDSLFAFMKRRRRQTNASLLLWLHYASRFYRYLHGWADVRKALPVGANRVCSRARHNPLRWPLFLLQLVVTSLNAILEWFLVSAFYLCLRVLFLMTFPSHLMYVFKHETPQPPLTNSCSIYFDVPYLFLFGMQVVYGLGSQLRSSINIYLVSFVLYGLLITAAAAAVVWHGYWGHFSLTVQAAAGISAASYILAALIHGELLYLLVTGLQYLFVAPSYINICTVYSFCNMHDVADFYEEGNFIAEQLRSHHLEAQKRAQAGAKSILTHDDQVLDMETVPAELQVDTDHVVAETVQAALLKQQLADQEAFAAFRNRLLCWWLAANVLYTLIIVNMDLLQYHTWGLGAIVIVIMVARLCGSLLYQFNRIRRWILGLLCKRCCVAHTLGEPAVTPPAQLTNIAVIGGSAGDELAQHAQPKPAPAVTTGSDPLLLPGATASTKWRDSDSDSESDKPQPAVTISVSRRDLSSAASSRRELSSAASSRRDRGRRRDPSPPRGYGSRRGSRSPRYRRGRSRSRSRSSSRSSSPPSSPPRTPLSGMG